MRRIANYFLRGLLITAPAALTLYVCWAAISWADSLLGVSIPGAGLIVGLAAITLIGALASNFLTRSLVAAADRSLARPPLVPLLYTSIKDPPNAFVGEHRRFNRPVRARIGEGSAEVYILGFVTSESLAHFGLDGHVAVYAPFSYSVAGHVLILPADRVIPLAVAAAETMAVLVSGGGARTAAERQTTPPQ